VELPYRRCVVAVVIDEQQRCLVGERRGMEGAWQLPQGGIEDGEQPTEALLRELGEEIGCADVEILVSAPDPVTYRFPPDLKTHFSSRYAGQTQDWFLVRLRQGAEPDLRLGDGEFQRLDWRHPREIVQGIVEWKREAYIKGLIQFKLWP